jgi:hypothetical protein
VPSTTSQWILQFGGHHLAINLTLAGSRASMTPSLPAAQPARFTIEGPRDSPARQGKRQGVCVINALDATVRSQAILNSRVADLVLGPGRTAVSSNRKARARQHSRRRNRRCCSS